MEKTQKGIVAYSDYSVRIRRLMPTRGPLS